MKNKLITITLAAGLSLTAQAQQFNGTGYNLNNGDFLIIQGTVNLNKDANQAHRERMARYEQMNAELSASIDSMRAQAEMRRQTRELREQTQLLRKIANE
jgi:alpha-D-ribose 1-methylphosphonate 5-triphosphate synthase subunit PhnG